MSRWDEAFGEFRDKNKRVRELIKTVKEETGWSTETILLKSMRNEFESEWSKGLNVDEAEVHPEILARFIME